MRIADEIDHVMREFVAFEDVFNALVEAEDLEPYQVASWFLRNREDFEKIPMLECSLERRDFRILETNWASDYFYELAAGGEVDWNADQLSGYRPGFLHARVRQFFKLAEVDYPESTMRRLQQKPIDQTTPSSSEKKEAGEDAMEDSDRPLGTRERTTLLTVIAALAGEANIQLVSPSKSAELIASMTEKMGTPVAKRTIEEHLKRVADALERKAR